MTTEAGPILDELDADAFDGLDVGDQEQVAEQPQQQVDVLQLASMILINANNRIAERAQIPVERQIALGQALATLELARWTREQFALNAQIYNGAVAAQQRAQEVAKGPAGIVVPRLG